MRKKKFLIETMEVAQRITERLHLNDFVILSFGNVFNSDQYELIYINTHEEIQIRTDSKEIYKYILRNAPTRRKD